MQLATTNKQEVTANKQINGLERRINKNKISILDRNS
jgi:hypothetical protein